jgi:soluble lytic murein transglycosylase-like protein
MMIHRKQILGLTLISTLLIFLRVTEWLPWEQKFAEPRAEEFHPAPVHSLPQLCSPSKEFEEIGEQGRKFDSHIQAAASKYNIDPCLVKAIIHAESRFDPKAVSHKGAKGLMQITPESALLSELEDLHNPGKNIDAGVRYLRYLLDLFDGSYVLTVAAYNAGVTRVLTYRGVPPILETHSFVEKVFNYYNYYRKSGWG